jgi:hypothetical protein
MPCKAPFTGHFFCKIFVVQIQALVEFQRLILIYSWQMDSFFDLCTPKRRISWQGDLRKGEVI